VRPSGVEVSSARACASTIESLSTYTTRLDGLISCAISCTFLVVGSPEPMSRNCLIPASVARYLTTRPRNRRFSRSPIRPDGQEASARSAISRSAAK